MLGSFVILPMRAWLFLISSPCITWPYICCLFNVSIFGGGGGGADEKDKRGLVPRCMEYVFRATESKSRNKKITLSLSFLEIYLEKIRDLGRYYVEV